MSNGDVSQAVAPGEFRSDGSEPAALKVLIVEDMFLNSEFLRLWVEGLGHEVCGIAVSVETATPLAETHRPDVILMDLMLDGEGDGVDAAAAIRRTQDPPIIFITACSEQASVERIIAANPFRVLPKPVAPQELSEALRVLAQTKAAAA